MKTLLLFAFGLFTIAHGMYAPIPEELVVQLEDHPRSTICFLHHYAHATFTHPYLYKTNLDDEKVSFGGICKDDGDAAYTLPWAQVKTILHKAYEDLTRVDVTNSDVGFAKDYKQVLWYVQNYDLEDCQDAEDWLKKIYENRKKYKEAFVAGNVTAINEALQLDLFLPHID